jgi:hypothetical protein
MRIMALGKTPLRKSGNQSEGFLIRDASRAGNRMKSKPTCRVKKRGGLRDKLPR